MTKLRFLAAAVLVLCLSLSLTGCVTARGQAVTGITVGTF